MYPLKKKKRHITFLKNYGCDNTDHNFQVKIFSYLYDFFDHVFKIN